MSAKRAVLSFTVAVLALTACGQADPGVSSRTTMSAPASPTSHSGTASWPPLVECRDLVAQKWVPPAREPEISWDTETGEALVVFGDETSLHLNILSDDSCPKVPMLGPLITQVVRQADLDHLSECRDVATTLSRGEQLSKDGLTASPARMLKYLRDACPSGVLLSVPSEIVQSVDAH